MSSGGRVLRNVMASIAGHGTLLVVALLVVPVLLHYLRGAGYGALALINSTLAFLLVLDLGVGPAIMREIARFAARDDRQGQARTVVAGLLCYSVQGLLGVVVVWWLAPLLFGSVAMPEELAASAQTALRVGVVGFALRLGLSAFAAVPAGLQRFDVVAKRRAAAGSSAYLLQAALAAYGADLPLLVAAFVGAELVGDLVLVGWALRRLERPRGRWLDLQQLRGIWRFSSMKFLHHAAVQGMHHGDRWIIGMFLGASAVAWYDVPMRLAQKLETLRDNVSLPYYSAACEATALDDPAALRRLYLGANRFLMIIWLPMAAGLVAISQPLLEVWVGAQLGANLEQSVQVLMWLGVAYAIIITLDLPASTVDAAGRPGLSAVQALTATSLQLSLAWALVPRFGIVGAAWALVAAAALVAPVFVHLVNRHLVGVSSREFLTRCVLRPLAAAVIMAAVVLPCTRLGSGPLWLAACIGLGAAVYPLAGLALRAFGRSDLDQVRQLLRPAASETLPSQPTS